MVYRAEVDGLRAIAVLPVLFFHAGFSLFCGGYVGVDVFFVISGYLITQVILLDFAAGTFSLRQFYQRRVRRILPALLVMAALILPLAAYVMLPSLLKDFGQSLVALVTFSSNILQWRKTGYFEFTAELKPLLHMWSLAVEEQFYFVYPLILIFLVQYQRRFAGLILALMAVVSLFGAQWLSERVPLASFYLAPTRAWELLIGALVAFAPQRSFGRCLNESAALGGIAAIVYACFSFRAVTVSPGFITLIPVLGAAATLYFARPPTFAARLLSLRSIVQIGLLSYSAYLWHQPLFAFARLIDLTQPTILVYSVLILISFAIAKLSLGLIEARFRNRTQTAWLTVIKWAGVLSFVLLGAGLVLHFSNGLQAFTSRELNIIVSEQNSVNPRQQECESGPGHEIEVKSACVLGETNAAETVALVGDSHADALFVTLDQVLRGRHRRGRFFSYAGCLPVPGFVFPQLRRDFRCADYVDQMYRELEHSPTITEVILAARWPIYLERSRFDNGEGGHEYGEDMVVVPRDRALSDVRSLYRDAIQRLIQSGKQVILIEPVPEVGWSVPEYLGKAIKIWRMPITPSLASTSSAVYRNRSRKVFEIFDSLPVTEKLLRVPTSTVFCDRLVQGRCITHVEGRPLYYDDNHLSRAGAELVVQLFRDQL